ncbi:MAG: hypothetical protein QM289_00365 [Bacillota bacterium]|jgi:hypothetical protein|nr:hypothetical protein [Bacillota bacterium]NLM07425.1 hypothetical protein [Clostridiales Family XIII bacterium]
MSGNKNIITVSEDFINKSLREKILSSPAGDYISDYKVMFSGGYIYLELALHVKTLGSIAAKYRLEIVDLVFRPGDHRLVVDYTEDVSSAGSLVQSLILKVAGLKGGTFLQTVVGMANPPGIRADSKSCSVDLEQLINFDSEFFFMLILEYLDCRDGMLQMTYQLTL